MHKVSTDQIPQGRPMGSKSGLWLFSCVYFIIFIAMFFFAARNPDPANSFNLLPNQPVLVRTLLSVFLSFSPLIFFAPFLGLHLGVLVYRSRIQFWVRALASGFINGFLFVYWTYLVYVASKSIGIAPPGTDATAVETLLIYPLICSVPFMAINMLLAVVIFLVYKRSA
jgi:hypothetical protein